MAPTSGEGPVLLPAGSFVDPTHDLGDLVLAQGLVRCGRRHPFGRVFRSDAKEARDEFIGYIEDNRCRIHYDQYRALGLTVGSGAIESGVKNVVNQRMKGCGMRWAIDRADYMLHLRAAYLSDVGPAHQLLAA